jgi:hypothetical protein
MKKILIILFLSISFFIPNVFGFKANVSDDAKDAVTTKEETKQQAFFDGLLPSDSADSDIAGKIRTGELSLSDVPLILLRLIDLFTKIAGTIAVAMIIWGGIQYVFSGITEEKESAKNTLKYAIIGLFVTFWAWIAVNMVQLQLTA